MSSCGCTCSNALLGVPCRRRACVDNIVQQTGSSFNTVRHQHHPNGRSTLPGTLNDQHGQTQIDTRLSSAAGAQRQWDVWGTDSRVVEAMLRAAGNTSFQYEYPETLECETPTQTNTPSGLQAHHTTWPRADVSHARHRETRPSRNAADPSPGAGRRTPTPAAEASYHQPLGAAGTQSHNVRRYVLDNNRNISISAANDRQRYMVRAMRDQSAEEDHETGSDDDA